jgi:hypothetical protein
VVKPGGAERRKTFLGRVNYYREWNADMVLLAVAAFVCKKVELVSIKDVPENDLVGVKFLSVFTLFFLIALIRNVLIVKVGALGKNKHRKKAETRHQ